MRHLLLFGLLAAILIGAVTLVGCGPEPQAAAQVPAPPSQLPASDPPPPTPKEWVGVWSPVSCLYDGAEQMGDAKIRDAIRLSIEKGEYKLYYLTDPVELVGKRLSVAALSVDEKAGTFALHITDGQKKGEKVLGIYELKGDTLKLCYAPADQTRPTKFEAPKGTAVFCEEWARAKLKK